MNRTREDREREDPSGKNSRGQLRVLSLMNKPRPRGVQYLDDEEETTAAAAVEAAAASNPTQTVSPPPPPPPSSSSSSASSGENRERDRVSPMSNSNSKQQFTYNANFRRPLSTLDLNEIKQGEILNNRSNL